MKSRKLSQRMWQLSRLEGETGFHQEKKREGRERHCMLKKQYAQKQGSVIKHAIIGNHMWFHMSGISSVYEQW